MKRPSFLLFICILLTSCTGNKAVDVYNKCVGNGNSAISYFSQVDQLIGRLESGFLPQGQYEQAKALNEYRKEQLKKMKALKQTEDNEAIIRTTIELLTLSVNSSENPEIDAVFQAIQEQETVEAAQAVLVENDEIIGLLYDQYEIIYQAYDLALNAYAEEHGIEQNMIGEVN